jgi:TPR repeat protein/outer membrane biosynthesis protein TonB
MSKSERRTIAEHNQFVNPGRPSGFAGGFHIFGLAIGLLSPNDPCQRGGGMRFLIALALIIMVAFAPTTAFALEEKPKNLKPFIGVNWRGGGDMIPAANALRPLRSARPGINADSWFPESEYPPEALSRELSGSAKLDVRLDASGKAIGCTFAEVKGDPILHRDACQTVLNRGRFLAELDSKGVAVATSIRLDIYWGVFDPDTAVKAPSMDRTRGADFRNIDPDHWYPASNSHYAIFGAIDWPDYHPDAAGLPDAASVGVDIIVLPDGRVGDCQVRQISGSSGLDVAGCNAVKSAMVSFKYSKPTRDTKVSAYIHWKGKSAILELADHEKSTGPRLSQKIVIDESDRPAGPAPTFAKTYVELTVGPDGMTRGCSIYRSSHSDDHDRKSCALLRERVVFSPARDTLGRPTYGDTQLVLDWSSLSAYWPPDYSASFDEEVTACQMGQAAPCVTVPYDADHGISLLKAGCKGNATMACRRLGEIYRAGKDTPASPSFAAYYLDLACKGPEGYPDDRACAAYAEMLMHGEGIAPDQPRAFKLFEGACAGWRNDGCYGLGKAYENGTGVTPDIGKAAEIYSGACKTYQSKSCLALELLYFEGRGVPQDQPRAVAYFEKLCGPSGSKEVAEACLLAGNAYTSGTGVTVDPVKGAQYWHKACISGNVEGCLLMAAVAVEGSLGRKDEATAIRYWQMALRHDPAQPEALEALRERKVKPLP